MDHKNGKWSLADLLLIAALLAFPMLPVFEFGGADKRRKINLGGSSSVSSSTAILQQVRAQRIELQETRRRQENAIRLQAWWRGLREVRSTRKKMRALFEEDVTGITGLRCLVLMGSDEEALALWSSTMANSDEGCRFFRDDAPLALTFSTTGALFLFAQGPQQASWLSLIRRVCRLLLCSVAKAPL